MGISGAWRQNLISMQECRMNDGWKCPNCGSAHAPWIATCPMEYVTWTTSGVPCNHDWIDSTAGKRCSKCGETQPPIFRGSITYSAVLADQFRPS